ncbi:TonB-dependent receptor [Erythrobacter colymbi]|uniref:TonB-dependent receptor n=1 Tax=Erythrobacter colymbi TaxID=1161202 RepID=UPI000A39BAA4|nr:TonB-dependent receptor [Erythrobacter colymbi]
MADRRFSVAHTSLKHLACGVSLAVLALGSQAALAQSATQDGEADEAQPETTTTDEGNIIVTGFRASLETAQSIKQRSDTVVDALSAEDIGALPDRSVNEALQRVPGVAITRYAAAEDSQHFSVEGSGVTIRGLNYVKGLFNGRDTFSVSGGREISYNDIAPELVGSIEVFKNLTADMIEGGISGTTSINTRRPFDSSKQLIYISGEANYGDLAERWAPNFTGVYSNQWDLPSGARIGFLASATWSKLYSKVDSAFIASPFERFNGTRTFNAGSPYASTVTDTFNCGAGLTTCYAPTGGGVRTQDFDRERIGLAASAQFATADDRLIATAAFLRTQGKNSWTEHTIEPNVWYPDVNATFPAAGTSYTFDENGVFVSGNITRPGGFHGGWSGGNWTDPLPNFQEGGIFTTQSNRGFLTDYRTDDHSLEIKFKASDRLRLSFDAQYIKARAKEVDQIIDTATWSNVSIDNSGKIPQIGFSIGRLPNGTTPTAEAYFANPNSLYFRDAFTDRDDNDGEEWAFRADAEYDLSDDSFLRRVRVGARYADRDQVVRNNNYNNWGAPSETWTFPNGAQTYATIDPSLYEVFQFNNFFRGESTQPPGAVFLKGNIAENYESTQELLRTITARATGNYQPIEDRACATVNTYFCPNEVFRNSERTMAGYVRLDFSTDKGGDSFIDGNIGVRYVDTLGVSFGSLTAPLRNQILPSTFPTVAAYCAAPRGPNDPIPPVCRLSPTEQANVLAFANGASEPLAARNQFGNWLPSLNIRFQANDELQFRFAASKAISRPNFENLRAFIGVNATVNQANDLVFTSNSRNPYLKPTEATQFDLTSEWYFDTVGSLTASLFYKRLSNVIDNNGQGIISATNNGQTFDVVLNGPANTDKKSSIKGFELAYQQTYDFLPGVLSGLGMQASYTWIDPGRIPTSTPANGAGDGARPPGEVNEIYGLLPLPQLSRHNINLAGFYEKGGLYARLAYSWRSRYLLSTRDCCFPFLPVFSEPTGQLDGSLFYSFNDNIKIGLQANNLLNEVTRTSFALYADGDRLVIAKRGAFITDRRYAFTVRLSF